MAFRKTQFTLTTTHTIRGRQYPEGQVIAEIHHPAELPVDHVLSVLRSSRLVKVRSVGDVEPSASDAAPPATSARASSNVNRKPQTVRAGA